jgi:hypothetical protein
MKARFEVLVCEVREDGLWPVVRLADDEPGESGPMVLRSGAKAVGLGVAPLRLALAGVLRSEAGMRLRAEMREILNEEAGV